MLTRLSQVSENGASNEVPGQKFALAMAIARAKGKLKGKKPKLSDRREIELRRMYDTGDYSISDLAELFDVSRPTVYPQGSDL